MSERHDRIVLLGYSVDLVELVRVLRDRWHLVAWFTAATFTLSLVYLHVVTFTYTATLIVSPVTSSSLDGLASKLGGLGSVASLAGFNIGSQLGPQSFMLYQNGLYSRDVADDLSKQPEILHEIFSRQWDSANTQWKAPLPVMTALSTAIEGVMGIPVRPWQPPDGALLQEYIVDNVLLETDPQKPIVTVTFRYKDAQFAAQFLNALHRTVDEKLRQNALQRANQYVGYLSSELKLVSNADEREALVTALTDEEKTRMMANVSAPFAAQPFGPASASRDPTYPKPALVIIGAIIVGGLLGTMGAIWLPPLRWPGRRVRASLRRPSLDIGQ